MKKIVNGCVNCPFYHTEYDDYSMGEPEKNICVLSQYLKLDNYFIELDENEYSPEWCPIKNEEYTLKFKEFSDKIKSDISTINKKIYEHEYQYDKNSDNDDFDYVANNIEHKELYKKLDELMMNDELESNDDDIKEDFNNSIDQVKNQLTNLEKLGNKLNDELNNLSNLGNI